MKTFDDFVSTIDIGELVTEALETIIGSYPDVTSVSKEQFEENVKVAASFQTSIAVLERYHNWLVSTFDMRPRS